MRSWRYPRPCCCRTHPVAEEEVSPNVVAAALALLGRLQSEPPTVHIALAQVVEKEWSDLHASKLKESEASVRRADEKISYLWGIASTMNSAPAGSYVQFRSLRFPQRLHDVAEKIVRFARVIEGNEDFQRAAGLRIGAGAASAAPRRPEYGDCLLTEQYLDLCLRLRANGFTHPCVFVSSNTRDFGEPKAPRPPLDREFRSIQLDFAYDFAAAEALLES